MNKIEFPFEKAQWDYHRAFHVHLDKCGNSVPGYSGFYAGWPTLFSTGELILTRRYRAPWSRGYYDSLGIAILTTRDIALYTPEGEPIPKSQLVDFGGQQEILVDLESGRAVGTNWLRDNTNIPPHLAERGAVAYIAGPGRLPIGSPIKARLPLSKAGYTPEQLQYIDEFVKLAKVTMLATNHPASVGSWPARMDRLTLNRLFEVSSWQELAHWEQVALFHRPPGRRVVTYPYLLTRPDGR